MENSKLLFKSIIVKEDKGYSSLCIDLDVASEGKTIDEAKNNLLEAVSLYIESALENNLQIERAVPEEVNPINTRPNEVVDIFKIKIDLRAQAYA